MSRTTTTLRALRAGVLLLVCSLLLAGCDFSVYKAPLPGGADTGDDPIQVKAEFRDVLDLVPQSTVKLNDVTVGKVTDISLRGYTAVVTMELKRGLDLPDNTRAELRQTSLLGEKFVSLTEPTGGSSPNPLQNGDVIGLDRTGRNPEVEEVLGALSLLLNGGGVGQLKTIASELNTALEGREGSTRSLLQQVDLLMTQLDRRKGDIVNAIEALNRLSKTANGQIDTIDAALRELPSALDTIDAQRDELVRMLTALDRLSEVGVRVIRASKDATIESLRQLNPVLTQIANSGDNFVKAFNVFLTYPFVDEVVGRDPQVARNLHMGDYVNLSIELDLNIALQNTGGEVVEEVCTTLNEIQDQVNEQLPANATLDEVLAFIDSIDDNLCGGAQRILDQCLDAPTLGRLSNCLSRNLEVTIRRLTQGTVDTVCQILGIKEDQCPELGGGGGGGLLPELPGITGGGSGGSGGLLGGLGRAPFGRGDPRGATMGQLSAQYDPALVSLLVPGLVTE
ncbi:MCE family protein [Nocardioides rotundus]|uniref:MCE family protein n=1 Tax=Nocardioides rotundus TaxID=1774216 RepID=UPI001CBE8A0F|nr:MCE family protein [Nocardioides rotundus]UAL30360.1 MCE family protein [Nocardioides rotundus]